jgi:ATP-dependent helicase/nuclease subunit A
VIHRVLEACAKNSRIKLDIFIENVLAEEGRLPLEKGDALEYVRGILRSPFWERVLRSKKRFVEIPFAQRTTAAAFAEKDTIVSGVIDLIFQDEGGWVVVDYKTDAVESEDELKALAEYYSPQLDLYRSFWEEITGERVVQAGFYFTSASKWVCRNFD